MSTQPHSPIAATAHFVEAERILVALALTTKRGERERQLGLALVNAVLSVAAVLIGDEPPQRRTITED